MPKGYAQGVTTRSGRERVLTAAYDLFSRSGIRDVGVDAITDEADVAKMTLYRNFGSKSELALAFLELRQERWLTGWILVETRTRAASPAGRLLAVFDIFTEWFARVDFEGCAFVRSLLEFDDRADPVRQACVEHLAGIRAYLCELATQAGALDPERFAAKWHILLQGSIVAAHEGDLHAAVKAREMGMLLLEREGLMELEPISRCGYLAASIVGPERMVRLAGELDAEAAATVAAMLDERSGGPICFDLSGLQFVDVAGLRALRGANHRSISLTAPSDAVLQLVDLLGWDSDPTIEFRPLRPESPA